MSPTVLDSDQNGFSSAGSARLFASLARSYWLQVFPSARACQRRLLERARSIPDPVLRHDALVAHREKRSNSEGLAALAVLAPPRHRPALVRSLVSYQLMLDYLDGVSERRVADQLGCGLGLHGAFAVALDPDAAHEDYYALAPASEDGGYLVALIETCREPLRTLPSYSAVRSNLLRQAALCRQSQALNHALRFEPMDERLLEWAGQAVAEAEVDVDLDWWEVIGAAAASSLTVGALLALAATADATAEDATRLESAYFPWASGLNALLDSLVDLDEDHVEASHVRRYASPQLAADRMEMIASQARRRLADLPDGDAHEAIFAAMGALYLADPDAWLPGREGIAHSVYRALGPHARPALLVHLLRRRGRGGRILLAAKRQPDTYRQIPRPGSREKPSR